MLALAAGPPSRAAILTWTGGDGTWTDGSGASSWSSADEPDADDIANFNSGHTVTLESGNTVAGVTMSGGIDLLMNGFDLDVDGAATLSGAGTRLEVADALSEFRGQNLTINSGAVVFMDGGAVEAAGPGAAEATISIAAGGTLSGNGTVISRDAFAAIATAVDNNGTLLASNPSALVISPPAAATLRFTGADGDARLDLDGSLETGAVTVNRNQTLDIDFTLADIFNGSLTMHQGTNLNMSGAWILGANAAVSIDNGAAGGQIGGIPAGTATIAGASFSQNSGVITVVDADGTLQFDAPFNMNGGTLTNNGHVIFNHSALLGPPVNFQLMAGARLTVGEGRTLTINQTNINFDGPVPAAVITVNAQGRIDLNSMDYDSDSVTDAFDGTINLNSGALDSETGDPEFVMNGVLNLTKTTVTPPVWSGETLQLGDDTGSRAALHAAGDGVVRVSAPVVFKSDADVTVAADTLLFVEGTTIFDTVNGGSSATFTGTGDLLFFGTVNVHESTLLNMTGGTVTLDGADGSGNTINIDAPLTVNARSLTSFGRGNTSGVNILDINNSTGTGLLAVNLDDAESEWTLNAEGVLNLLNDSGANTLLAGSDVNIHGTIDVTGDVRTTARLDIESTGTINIGAQGRLRLGGGNAGPDVNTIRGGTIGGNGVLCADTARHLEGYGAINTDVDFDGTASLLAYSGTLFLNAPVIDVNILGTTRGIGTLRVNYKS